MEKKSSPMFEGKNVKSDILAPGMFLLEKNPQFFGVVK